MKIILTKKIERLGNIGDIIDIKNGYAKNYIIPMNNGLLATSNNIKNIKSNNFKNEDLSNKEEENNFKKINGLNILIPVSVKKDDEIYGSFNQHKLLKIIKNLHINLHIKNLENFFSIKRTGSYEIFFKNKKIKKNTCINIRLIKTNK